MATSMFSRRHYEAIAAILKETGEPNFCFTAFDMWDAIKDRLADLFAADNERFSRKTFEEECER
jgi:hypothetical protein